MKRMITALVVSLVLVSTRPSGAQPRPPLPYAPVPPPQVEVVPPPRGERFVWEPGHWHWDGVRYVWIAGHYVVRAPHYGHYVEGHWGWSPHEGRWVWRPAHWE